MFSSGKLKHIIIALLFLALLAPLGLGGQSAEAQIGADTPILLVVNDSVPYQFGRYLGDILTAEGLNSFITIQIGALTAADLTGRDLVILAETALTPGQATLISSYVTSGGRLLAMRPDPQIAGLFGLGTTAGTRNSAYLRIINGAVVNGSAPGLGLTSETMQYKGLATQYNTQPGAVTLAQLYSNATTSTSFPAVVGTSDGRAVAFTYDLARSVIFMRQGNPANANIDTDGDGVLRTIDLWQTGGISSWVDLNKVPVPQVDEQQRLFARLVKQAVESVRPLPQMWYFPGTAKTVLVATGDAHANPLSWYQNLINRMNTYNGDITVYVSIGQLDNAEVQNWISQGHDFGIHPYAYRPDSYEPFNIESLAEGYYVYDNWFSMQFTSPKSPTVRNHQVAWLGWTDAAELARSYGIRLDTNFYHGGPWLQKPYGT